MLTAWRDINHAYWGNAAFAVFNAVTATYAVTALMGVRHALVDVVLGLVERLYVTGEPSPAPVRVRPRRAAVLTHEVAHPGWRDVLYRGAAATATGQHVSDATGSFRIVAQPVEPPTRQDRRASDRLARAEQPDRRGRRASDRGERPTPARRDRRATDVATQVLPTMEAVDAAAGAATAEP